MLLSQNCEFISHNADLFFRIARYKHAAVSYEVRIAGYELAIVKNKLTIARYKVTILSFLQMPLYISYFGLFYYNSDFYSQIRKILICECEL